MRSIVRSIIQRIKIKKIKKRFTNIIVVVNYLIKIQYIIPIDLINIILVAKCFIKHVFKLYGLSNLIVSNYRSQFILDF
jgi:hypothetical protein